MSTDGSSRTTPRVNYGLVARGPFAVGVVAVGGIAVGVVAVGAVSVGVIAIGAVSAGAVAIGGLAIGLRAVAAIGWGVFATTPFSRLFGVAYAAITPWHERRIGHRPSSGDRDAASGSGSPGV